MTSRLLAWGLLLSLVLALPIALQALGEPPAPTLRLAYGLKYAGEDRQACDEGQLSLREEAGSGARCGRVKLDPPCRQVCIEDGSSRGAALSYPLAGTFNRTVHPGFKGQARISLWFEAPDEVRVAVGIVVGNVLWCRAADPSPRTVLADEWLHVELPECTFGGSNFQEPRPESVQAHSIPQPSRSPQPPSSSAPQPATGSLRVEVAVSSQLNHYIGHEGEHVSWIKFDAAPSEDAPPPDRREEPRPAGGTPGPSIAAGWVAAAAGAVLARGRRSL